MSSFNSRTNMSDKLIEILNQFFWSKLNTKIVHYEYGYETHIDPKVQSSLKIRKSNTAKHVRFAPDFIVYNKLIDTGDFLCEYKVTKTPKYTFNDTQWYYGQIEADAFENYMNLINSGITVAVVIYCPYSERPLLCDFPNEDWLISPRSSTNNSSGSGTDYYNIDLRKIRTFENFIQNQLGIPNDTLKRLLSVQMYNELKNTDILQTSHAYKSPYNNSEYSTGFNWKDI